MKKLFFVVATVSAVVLTSCERLYVDIRTQDGKVSTGRVTTHYSVVPDTGNHACLKKFEKSGGWVYTSPNIELEDIQTEYPRKEVICGTVVAVHY